MVDLPKYNFVTELEDTELPKGSYTFSISLLEVSQYSAVIQHTFSKRKVIGEDFSMLEMIKELSIESKNISEGTFIIYDCFISTDLSASELVNRLIENGKLSKSLLNKSNYIN